MDWPPRAATPELEPVYYAGLHNDGFMDSTPLHQPPRQPPRQPPLQSPRPPPRPPPHPLVYALSLLHPLEDSLLMYDAGNPQLGALERAIHALKDGLRPRALSVDVQASDEGVWSAEPTRHRHRHRHAKRRRSPSPDPVVMVRFVLKMYGELVHFDFRATHTDDFNDIWTQLTEAVRLKYSPRRIVPHFAKDSHSAQSVLDVLSQVRERYDENGLNVCELGIHIVI
jgi:hypothetical protein